jgi:predicted transcriptional regulator
MLKLIVSVAFLFLLSSCKDSKSTYEYLMQHPAFLQQELIRCQMVVVQDEQCSLVKRASGDFATLMTELQTNQEQFGEKIMRAQLLQATSHQEIKEMKKKIAELSRDPAQSKQLDEAKMNLQKAEVVYQTQRSNAKILIAVVGMMRME